MDRCGFTGDAVDSCHRALCPRFPPPSRATSRWTGSSPVRRQNGPAVPCALLVPPIRRQCGRGGCTAQSCITKLLRKQGFAGYVWDGDVRCVAANGLLELRLTWEQLSAGEPCPGWVRPCQGFRIDLPGLAIPFIQGVATDCGSYGCECNLLRVQRGARPGLFLLRGMRLPVFSVHRPNSWPSPGLARYRLRVRPGIPSSSIFPQPSRSSWIRIEVMLTTKRSARPWTVGWRKPVFDITPSTGADRSGQPARHAPRPCRPGGRRLVRRWTPEVIVNIASTWRRPTGWPARRTVRTATPGRVARWCSPDDGRRARQARRRRRAARLRRGSVRAPRRAGRPRRSARDQVTAAGLHAAVTSVSARSCQREVSGMSAPCQRAGGLTAACDQWLSGAVQDAPETPTKERT